MSDLNIRHYILSDYELLKLTETIYQLNFNVDEPIKIPSRTTQFDVIKRCDNLTQPFSRSETAEMKIESMKILVQPNAELAVKKVVQLKLNIEAFADIDYKPGDTIGILPYNNDSDVQQLLESMDLLELANNCCVLEIAPNCKKKNAKLPTHIPKSTTPYEILKYCLNLRAVPKKQLIRALAECCSDVNEQNFLNSLCSKHGKSFYDQLILQIGLNLLDLLHYCTSCKPKLELLIEYLPRLLPRPYSIANSPLVHDGSKSINIIYSILAEQPGVTTQMLNDLIKEEQQLRNEKPKIVTYFRDINKKFRYTTEIAEENAQILIAIGTGLAPFLGFLFHKQELQNTRPLGETRLLVGAPTQLSILYDEQLNKFKENSVLSQYIKCCSREEQTCNGFRHVNDFIMSESKEFVEFLMQPKTKIYICADGAKISLSIETTIVECLKQQLEMTITEVEALIAIWKTEGKYCEDIWT